MMARPVSAQDMLDLVETMSRDELQAMVMRQFRQRAIARRNALPLRYRMIARALAEQDDFIRHATDVVINANGLTVKHYAARTRRLVSDMMMEIGMMGASPEEGFLVLGMVVGRDDDDDDDDEPEPEPEAPDGQSKPVAV